MSRSGGTQSSGSIRYFFVLAALAFGLATLLLLHRGDRGSLPEPTQELALWQVFITFQVIVWILLAGAGISSFKKLTATTFRCPPNASSRGRHRLRIILFVILAYAILGIPLLSDLDVRNPPLIPGQGWKLIVLHVIAGASAVPFVVTLKSIQLYAADDAAWSTSACDIEDVNVLRRALRTATASIGAIIALAVIASGFLRAAVSAAGIDPLPESSMLIYGAWQTAFLTGLYLHVFTALDGRARTIIEEAAPRVDPTIGDMQEFSSRNKFRTELAQTLELGGDPRKNLEGLVAIFSPLISAMLSQLGGLNV